MSDKWIDRIVTRLNACSLETLHEPISFIKREEKCISSEKKKDESDGLCGGETAHHYDAWPMIIGSYQLNEQQDKSEQTDEETSAEISAVRSFEHSTKCTNRGLPTRDNKVARIPLIGPGS